MPLLLLHRIGSELILWQPLPQPHSVNDSICYNVIQLLRQKKAQPLPHRENGPLQFVFVQCFVQIVGPLNFRSMFNLNKVYIALNLTFKNEEIRTFSICTKLQYDIHSSASMCRQGSETLGLLPCIFSVPLLHTTDTDSVSD